MSGRLPGNVCCKVCCAHSFMTSISLRLFGDVDMVARAGFPARACQSDITFSYRSTGDGSATTDDSTHPGYDDRLAAMTKHYDALEKETLVAESGPAALMRNDHNANLLTVLPQSR